MSARNKSTRVESAYERLKNAIMQGELPAGFQSPEPELANRLGMSRTPVREALIRLEAEKLVRLVPRRGARVLPLSRNDFKEIFEILASLEALGARHAAQMGNPEHLLQMEELATQCEAAAANSDLDAWASLDDRFHRALARAGGSVRLEWEIGLLLTQLHRGSRVILLLNNRPMTDTGHHRAVHSALKEGKAAEAGALLSSRRMNDLECTLRLFESQGLSEV